MKYWFINFEEEQYWIEVEDDNIATRQIIKDKDDNINISCKEDCLAEGVINIEDFEGYIKEISLGEFEKIWNKTIKDYCDIWKLQKQKYPIGKIVEGEIKYFYPQGIIIKIGEAMGIYRYRESNVIGECTKYPLDMIKGRVEGYDEKNLWLVISSL